MKDKRRYELRRGRPAIVLILLGRRSKNLIALFISIFYRQNSRRIRERVFLYHYSLLHKAQPYFCTTTACMRCSDIFASFLFNYCLFLIFSVQYCVLLHSHNTFIARGLLGQREGEVRVFF